MKKQFPMYKNKDPLHVIKNSFFIFFLHFFSHSTLYALPLTHITTQGFNIGHQSVRYSSTSFFKRLLNFNLSSYFRITSKENNTRDTAIYSFNDTDTLGNSFAVYTASINKKDYFIYETQCPYALYFISKIDVLDTLHPYFKEKKDPIAFLIHQKKKLKKEYTQKKNALALLKKKIAITQNIFNYNKYYFLKKKEQYENLQKKLLIIKEALETHVIFGFNQNLISAYTKQIASDHWAIVRPGSEEILATLKKDDNCLDFEIHTSTPFIPDNALLMMAAILHRKENASIGQKQDLWISAIGLLGSLGLAGAIHLLMKEKQNTTDLTYSPNKKATLHRVDPTPSKAPSETGGNQIQISYRIEPYHLPPGPVSGSPVDHHVLTSSEQQALEIRIQLESDLPPGASLGCPVGVSVVNDPDAIVMERLIPIIGQENAIRVITILLQRGRQAREQQRIRTQQAQQELERIRQQRIRTQQELERIRQQRIDTDFSNFFSRFWN